MCFCRCQYEDSFGECTLGSRYFPNDAACMRAEKEEEEPEATSNKFLQRGLV